MGDMPSYRADFGGLWYLALLALILLMPWFSHRSLAGLGTNRRRPVDPWRMRILLNGGANSRLSLRNPDGLLRRRLIRAGRCPSNFPPLSDIGTEVHRSRRLL